VSYVNTLSDSAISFATLHSRLGHPNADTIKIISKLCNIPIINKTGSDFCSHCCVGKSHRLPSSPSLTEYSTPFELIYTDLWGSSLLSNTGYRYYVTFVDAHTRFTWLYVLKSKSETLTLFKEFLTLVKNSVFFFFCTAKINILYMKSSTRCTENTKIKAIQIQSAPH